MNKPTPSQVQNLLSKAVSNCIEREHLEKRLLA